MTDQRKTNRDSRMQATRDFFDNLERPVRRRKPRRAKPKKYDFFKGSR
jgi:hypothetical protein